MVRTSRIFITLMFVATLVTACAMTRITAVWKDPAYQGTPRKVMVIGIARKAINKRIFEDELVRQLKARGTDAVAGYTVMDDTKQADNSVIAARMKEQGADTVLIARLVSKKTLQTYVPGSIEYYPTYYGNWRDYYGHGSQVIYNPAYVVEEQYAVVETNLYDAGTDKLIWSASSETEVRGSNEKQIRSYIDAMVKAMADQHLLK